MIELFEERKKCLSLPKTELPIRKGQTQGRVVDLSGPTCKGILELLKYQNEKLISVLAVWPHYYALDPSRTSHLNDLGQVQKLGNSCV